MPLLRCTVGTPVNGCVEGKEKLNFAPGNMLLNFQMSDAINQEMLKGNV